MLLQKKYSYCIFLLKSVFVLEIILFFKTYVSEKMLPSTTLVQRGKCMFFFFSNKSFLDFSKALPSSSNSLLKENIFSKKISCAFPFTIVQMATLNSPFKKTNFEFEIFLMSLSFQTFSFWATTLLWKVLKWKFLMAALLSKKTYLKKLSSIFFVRRLSPFDDTFLFKEHLILK